MSYGSRVVGDTLECAFHGWRYNGEGRCAHIPYANKIPTRACIRSLPVREANGLIMAYYDAEGKPPSWEIPVLPEYDSEEWSPCAIGPRGEIRTHPQELMENGVDTAHLGPWLRTCSGARSSARWTSRRRSRITSVMGVKGLALLQPAHIALRVLRELSFFLAREMSLGSH